DMSAPQTIAGLAEGLLGAKMGDERSVPVKFPEDSPAKELAGKQAVFKVKITAIKEKNIPVLDDEFAKDLGVESLDVLKTRLRENLEREKKYACEADLEKQIVEKLLEEHPSPVPPSVVERQTQHLVERQSHRLLSQGVSKEDVNKAVEKAMP